MRTSFACRRSVPLFLAALLMAGAAQPLIGEPQSPGGAGEIPRDHYFTLGAALETARTKFPHARPAVSPDLNGIIQEEGLVYARRGGRELHLDLFRPARTAKGVAPAVLLIHGGGWRSGEMRMERPMAQRLAAAGYLAATVEYRLSPEATYPAALCDIRDALRWLRSNADRYRVDTNGVGLVGGSSGGHLAALLGTVQEPEECRSGMASLVRPLAVRAVVNFDGPVDLTDSSESGKDADPARPSSARRWLGCSYADCPERWRNASPAFLVNGQTAPILFVNSSELRFRAGREAMVTQMALLGIDREVCELPDSPHPFWLLLPWADEAFVRAAGFLDRHLR